MAATESARAHGDAATAEDGRASLFKPIALAAHVPYHTWIPSPGPGPSPGHGIIAGQNGGGTPVISEPDRFMEFAAAIPRERAIEKEATA